MRRALTAFAFTVAALVGVTGWLLASDSGLRGALQLAGSLSGGRLQSEAVSGRLLGPLHIGKLRWQTEELQIDASGLRLEWTPSALFAGLLQVDLLAADELQIVTTTSAEPTSAPENILLPLAIEIGQISVGQIRYGDAIAIKDLAAHLASDGQQHALQVLRSTIGDTAISGEARLDGGAGLAIEAKAAISGQVEERPLALDLQAGGHLREMTVKLVGRAGIEGTAEAILTPFAAAPFASAHIALTNVDPAAWLAAAPSARLSLEADLVPQGDGVAGQFSLINAEPGTLDRQRLPLSSLSGRVDWLAAAAELRDLRVELAGSGRASGSGRWQNGRLDLELALRQIDAGQIVSRLQRTRLNGTLVAALAGDEQSLKLNLQDARYVLAAEASHTPGQIAIPRLEVRAGEARLSLAGRLALAGEQLFEARGEFQHFDPSRFGDLPVARINGQFTGNGRLAPRPVVDASFRLADSRLADQPLSGEGEVNVDWPRIPRADIRLQAGANHLQAQGAFGRPGDVLNVLIDAPTLDPYGLEGGLKGRLELRGSLAQPTMNADLQATYFALPGVAAVRQLSLQAATGSAAEAPVNVDLRIGQLSLGEQTAAVRELRFTASGSNRQHAWQAGGELADGSRLTLAAAGGLEFADDGPLWRGRLLEARLAGSAPSRNVTLSAPGDLRLGRRAWSVGPLQLAGDPLDWRATVHADADGRRLQASLSASGSRIGRVDGQFSAALHDAWQLDRQAPWQGKLAADINDLSWLGELIGEGWQSAGRFTAMLNLAGTPAQPSSNGQFAGESLALRQPAQALALIDGVLAADLQDNLLRIRRLSFTSQLQPLPRALRLHAGAQLAELTRQPGRLEVTGEMRIAGANGGDQAALDVRLERVGIFQLPEQWVALSGTGRLTWSGHGFGASGQLAVDAGYWQLAPGGIPRLSEDVIVRRSDDVPPPALRPPLELDVSTNLGRHFLFSGAGLNSRLSGDLRLRASGRDLPRASGSIRLRDGRFDAYGQRLAISRGILTFQGLLDNPALDVLAVRQGLSVEPGVQISGTAQRPVIRLVSDPDLPDAEKLAWLVLGHGPETMGAGDATILLAAAGGLLGNNSGGVVQQLKTTFGIDEFGVRQGELGSAGGRPVGSRIAGSTMDTAASTGNQILSIGKRLSSNALLSYEQALGRAEGIVKLTVNLNRQVSIVGRAGSDNALDIFYTLAFGRPKETRRPPPSDD
jgi:translocation and assembly module TamB